VQVAAPPVDGRANEALRVLLADVLGVERTALAIVAGRGGRDKVVEVAGRDAHEVEGLMAAAASAETRTAATRTSATAPPRPTTARSR
jgi:uncharacterized protein YggU (UPF0235/DUF167 family)